MRDFLEVCEAAARAGGQTLLEWQGRFRTMQKGVNDLVTDADMASQEAIRELILQSYPNHLFLGEERCTEVISEIPTWTCSYRWVVDPLDGTSNYVHGLPLFAVSVALERGSKSLTGVVYDPIADECFSAAEGEGAFLNGQCIKPTSCCRIDDALLAVSFPANVMRESVELRRFAEVMHASHSVRRLGSTALSLSYVACGRLDGYFGSGVKHWDVAAGALILREAGGILTSLDGKPLDLSRCREFAASATSRLHAELIETLARAT